MKKTDDIADTQKILSLLGSKFTVDILLFIFNKDGAIWTEIRDATVGKGKSGDTITKRLKELMDEGMINKRYNKMNDTDEYFIDDKGKDIVSFINKLNEWVVSKKPSKKGKTKDLSKFK
jgi:DNA-binding HxlR family transcriptional regulator